MQDRELTFALLMPTLNEVEGLRHILPKIDRSLFTEILVVDGHSTDGTVEYCRAQGVPVLIQPNGGVPDAEEYGFKQTTADVVITFTPDGNSLPELLPAVCEAFRQGYDMVVASRYLGDAKSHDDDFLTGIGNWGFTSAVNLLFRAKFTDTLVGFRGYTREAAERMGLPDMIQSTRLRRRFPLLNSWELGASIRAARLKLRVLEIPGDEPKRIGGVRKLSISRNGVGALCQVISDFVFFRPRS